MAQQQILLGGFAHESNTFTPLSTSRRDFWIYDDPGDLSRLLDQKDEYGGALMELTRLGYEVLFIIAAGATVGGTIDFEVYQEYGERLRRRLEALDLQQVVGIQWVMHGSSVVKGVSDVQTDLIRGLHTLLPKVPIVVSYDLHSSLTWNFIRRVDGVVHYHTAPHRDQWETGVRASQMLHRAIMGQESMDKVLIKLPMLLPGEFGQTDQDVMAEIYNRLTQFQAASGAIEVSLSQGFPWADSPSGTVGLLGYWREGHARHYLLAFQALARDIWARRHLLYQSVPLYSLDEVGPTDHPTIFCDAGDNPTAGGAEDRVDVLEEVLRKGVSGVLFFPIVDPDMVQNAFQWELGFVDQARLGGRLGGTKSVSVQAAVIGRGQCERTGRWALLRIQGNDVVVTEKRFGVSSPFLLRDMGIDMAGLPKAWVVKSGYLFPAWKTWLREVGGEEKLLATAGSTTLDLETLLYQHLSSATYPISRSAMMEAQMDVWWAGPGGVTRTASTLS